MRSLLVILAIIVMVPGSLYAAATEELRTWSESQSAFTTDLYSAEPIDKYLSQETSGYASTAVGEVVYVAYAQSDGIESHVYLARVKEGDVEVWDDDSGSNGDWNSHLQYADPIDAVTFGQSSKSPAIAADSSGNVYIAYVMEDSIGSNNFHLYLSRYNATTQRMEIWVRGSDISGITMRWSTTRSDANHAGAGIDAEADSTGQSVSGSPKMVVNNADDVFIAYLQSDGTQNHLYVARYDASAGLVQGWDTAPSDFSPDPPYASPPFTTVRDDFEDAADYIDHIVAASATTAFDIATGGPDGHVYFVYVQEDATPDFHMGFTRYNGESELIERFNQNAHSFTATLDAAWASKVTNADDDADFIDVKAIMASTANVSGTPTMAVNSQGDVYIAYALDDATPDSHVYLSRYQESTGDMQCWNSAENGGAGGFTQRPGAGYWFPFANCDEANDTLDAQVAAKDADHPQLVIDSNGNVYVAFLQEDATGNEDHIYLTRMVAATETLERWNNDSGVWTTVAADTDDAGDMIDLPTSSSSSSALKMAVDNKDDIFITYIQQDSGGTNNHLSLTRYDSSAEEVQGWDTGNSAFTTNFADVDPIDLPTSTRTSGLPGILATSSGALYIPYLQKGDQSLGNAMHLQVNTFTPASTPSNDSGGGSMSIIFLLLLMVGGIVRLKSLRAE